MARPNHIQGRLFSPPPIDRMKDSILRDSGMGWNASSIASNTASSNLVSPLRIAKRDSPNIGQRHPQLDDSGIARRSSSSYQHVRKNNLVSKSPFKSQIPTPSTPSRSTPVSFPTSSPRRVSGEKRPRPSSMHDQAEAENERPFSYKRERTQSKTFQGLIEKEPVTKSPFKKQSVSKEEVLPPPPPPPRILNDNIPNIPSVRALPFVPTDARSFVPVTNLATPNSSPTRSSLVSRRLHGPRIAGKRERRKTVTFDERCDVLEFDREEGESDVFVSDDDQQYEHEDEGDTDPFFLYPRQQPESRSLTEQTNADEDAGLDPTELHCGVVAPERLDDSYESIALSDGDSGSVAGLTLDPDSSITGLVDEMFSHAQAAANLPMPAARLWTSTPPASPGLPVDLETEDGVPLGRSHHRERQRQHRQEHHAFPSPVYHPHQQAQPPVAGEQPFPDSSLSLSLRFDVPSDLPTTPPRRNMILQSEGPVNLSTHMERAQIEDEQDDEDAALLPASPSPMKILPSHKRNNSGQVECQIPAVKLPMDSPVIDRDMDADGTALFSHSSFEDESLQGSSFVDDTSLDPANLSIGHSDVCLGSLDMATAVEANEDAKQDSIRGDQSERSLVYDDDHDEMWKEEVHSHTPELPIPPPEDAISHRSTSPGLHDLPKAAFTHRSVSTSRESSPSTPASPLLRANTSGCLPLSAQGSSASLSLQSPSISPQGHGRPRITREEVQRRMLQGPRPSASPMLPNDVHLINRERQQSLEVEIEDDTAENAFDTSDQQVHLEQKPDIVMPSSAETDANADDQNELSARISASKFNLEAGIDDVAEGNDFPLLDASRMPKSDAESIRSVRTTSSIQSGVEFGLRVPPSGFGLNFDFGSKFGLGGLGIEGLSAGSANSKQSAEIVAKTAAHGPIDAVPGSPTEMCNVDVEMRSALDRLMEDVGGAGGLGASDTGAVIEDSFVTATEDEDSYLEDHSAHKRLTKPMQRAATDTVLFPGPGGGFIPSSRSVSSSSMIPPPVPPKDNIRSREEMILERRRQARRRDEGDGEEDFGSIGSPPPPGRRMAVSDGRPSRRRSMSTGDAEKIQGSIRNRSRAQTTDPATLDVSGLEDGLTDTIEKELKKLGGTEGKYQVKERDEMIYASSELDRVSHMAGPGDMNTGKAWRTVRRPSDMNEYSKQIKEYRLHANSSKAYGRVFVRVIRLSGLLVPLPDQQTAITCTLNNGKHFVTTPACLLGQDSTIQQEFELVEERDLEFMLTIKVRRDAHIIAQFKALSPTRAVAPPPPPVVVQSSSKGGVLSFFHSSPKKSKEKKVSPPPLQPSQPTQRLPENLARYLKTDGTLGRALVAFQAIGPRCDARIFETTYPVIGQRLECGNKFSSVQIGELALQIFRLPPLPGIHPEQLPRSIDECRAGLRHINWHKITYLQGVLTQTGGDCNSWRRRQFRVIGSNLVAFNDVTKKATITIDLKRAIAVEDDQESRNELLSPTSSLTSSKGRFTDDYEILGGVERSFRIVFPGGEEIIFFADTDAEKAQWLEVLRAMVGHVPPHPLWAELLWQRQEDMTKHAPLTSGSTL